MDGVNGGRVMPKRKDIKRVMVIGSGPIVIGQAAEFDYAGSQACRALKEEGIEVILVNSNPATIMTDTHIADRVYVEPLTVEFVEKVIEKEKPDGFLPTLGGQVGLNLAVELAKTDIFKDNNIELLGTPLETIAKAEDRELFKKMMEEIGEPVPDSKIISSIEEALDFAGEVGFPLIVRPAYTLGGTGGGIAEDMDELKIIAGKGLKHSLIHQILVEKSVAGWKEIEYEVMRDSKDNCITICNMENIDPVGIHTGDSIVVAPSQTLSNEEYKMLKSASFKIIRALGIEGGCNVQFALDPNSMQYYVIEVNPRVSRSSALASKATGYPIAKVAAKIAIGLGLDEIKNSVTGKTYACFEPALDYIVVKIPRWPFDKFTTADRRLGTQMKATGEVMAIGRTFESAFLKALRSLEIGIYGLKFKDLEEWDDKRLRCELKEQNDERAFIIAEAFRRGLASPDEVREITGIDIFFLNKLKGIVQLEKELASMGNEINRELFITAKKMGFSDHDIASILQRDVNEISEYRRAQGILPVYKMVDTCAAEFHAVTPYYYSTYDKEDEATVNLDRKVIVIGSGPIRIGQGIEFDYCSVHSAWALREEGLKSIIVNNNPETVSTDFDTSNRLYFEPLTEEDVVNIIDKEKPEGVVVQFGGQTAINLAEPIENSGASILGTSVTNIDAAEDRDKFDRLLQKLEIPKPPGGTGTSFEEAKSIAERIGYPVLVRPSYVLGGRAMEIVYNEEELLEYMNTAVLVSRKHPVLVDKYLVGKEVEVDAISDGTDILIPGIMEHVERAGVHSGDSIAVYPHRNLTHEQVKDIVENTIKVARALEIKGLLNIQYVIHKDKVYILEVNPRSSRTVPFISKVTGVPMVKLATKIILGHTLKDMNYKPGLWPHSNYVAVKVPVFSFSKLLQVDTSLGPEMKSTGEVMGLDIDFPRALYKGLVAAGLEVPAKGSILITVADKDKTEVVPLVKELMNLGYDILATRGTAAALQDAGLRNIEVVNKMMEGSPNIEDLIRSDKIKMIINTLTRGKMPERDGFKIRRAAVEFGIPCLTSLDTANAMVSALKWRGKGKDFTLIALQDVEQNYNGGML